MEEFEKPISNGINELKSLMFLKRYKLSAFVRIFETITIHQKISETDSTNICRIYPGRSRRTPLLKADYAVEDYTAEMGFKVLRFILRPSLSPLLHIPGGLRGEMRTRFATASLERKPRKVKNCLPGVPMKCEFRARLGGSALKAARKLDLSARSDGAISCWKQRTERRSTTIFQCQRKA